MAAQSLPILPGDVLLTVRSDRRSLELIPLQRQGTPAGEVKDLVRDVERCPTHAVPVPDDFPIPAVVAMPLDDGCLLLAGGDGMGAWSKDSNRAWLVVPAARKEAADRQALPDSGPVSLARRRPGKRQRRRGRAMDAAARVLYTFAMRSPVAWSRPEPFGAWVRLDDATLVAVDGELAGRLGVPHSDAAPAGPTRPLELHMAVTARCFAPCAGCYLDARPDGAEPPLDAILERLRAARDLGASTIALGGGEPLLRDDLRRIAEEARALGLVPVMTTSGIGLTLDRIEELRAFAQINVSHDGEGEGYRAVRGFDGRSAAERAIEALSAAGIRVGVNVVLTRATFDLLPATAERARALGAEEIQLLRYKPAGRAADAGYEERRLSPEQVAALWPAIANLVGSGRFRVRIDCAMVPLLSSALLAEPWLANAAPPASGRACSADEGPAYRPPDAGERPRARDARGAAGTLTALGVFGCEAARHLGALRVDGTLAPCSFFSVGSGASVGPLSAGASVGTVAPASPLPPERLTRRAHTEGGAATTRTPTDGGAAEWSLDVELRRFREYHASPPEPCRSCELFAVCRGGCQVVSRSACGGSFAPDPECPRVRAHAGAEPSPTRCV